MSLTEIIIITMLVVLSSFLIYITVLRYQIKKGIEGIERMLPSECPEKKPLTTERYFL